VVLGDGHAEFVPSLLFTGTAWLTVAVKD
jgi:hypothetical protein